MDASPPVPLQSTIVQQPAMYMPTYPDASFPTAAMPTYGFHAAIMPTYSAPMYSAPIHSAPMDVSSHAGCVFKLARSISLSISLAPGRALKLAYPVQ